MKKRVVRIPGVTLRLVAVVVAVIYLAGSIAMVPAAVEQAGARLAKAPAFAKQPVSLTVCERYPASFSVTATGDAPFFTNGFNNEISSARRTRPSRSRTPGPAMPANYAVVVSNARGSVTSAPEPDKGSR